jgi:hypothetical protein
MQIYFSKATCFLPMLAFVACVLDESVLKAQTSQDEQVQRIAISILADKAELNVDSGIDFARVDAIAAALEKSGHENVVLFVNSPVSIPTTSTDYMMIRITGPSAQINSGSKISTLRLIVEALKSTGVDKTTLVGHKELFDPTTKEMRISRHATTNKKLHRSARSTALTRSEISTRTR